MRSGCSAGAAMAAGAGASRVPGAAAGEAAGRRPLGSASAVPAGGCGGGGCAGLPGPTAGPRRAPSRYPRAAWGFARISGMCGVPASAWEEGSHRERRCKTWLTKPRANEAGLFVLQDFKVGNLLGKGSFAGVYRAVSLKTGLEVAIKMVRQPAREVSVSLETKCKVAAG